MPCTTPTTALTTGRVRWWWNNTLWYLLLLLFSGWYAQAQTELPASPPTLRWVWPEGSGQTFRRFETNWQSADSARVGQVVDRVLQALHAEGYLRAYFQQLLPAPEGQVAIRIIPGPLFRWEAVPDALDLSALPASWRNSLPTAKSFSGQPFRYADLKALQIQVLRRAENEGYPFAQVWADSLAIGQQTIRARLSFQTGPLVVFDTLLLQAEGLNVRKRFLSALLGIRKGEPFRQRSIDQISTIIGALPWAKLKAPPEVRFEFDRAFPDVQLAPVRASQLDGVLGVLPNAAPDGRAQLTGQFLIELHNPFGQGRRIHASWQRMKALSQQLRLEYSQPALFGSRLMAEGQFHLLREDSTFLNVNRRIGIGYQTGPGQTLTLLAGLLNGNLTTRQDPLLASTRLLSYGLRYQHNRLDDLFLPRKGFWMEGSAEIGNKTVSPLPLPDSVLADRRQVQWMASWQVRIARPTGKQTVLSIRHQSGAVGLLAPGPQEALYPSDLYRLGGLRTLRGFNESIFFASAYSVQTVEWQVFFEASSYAFLFVDQAFIQTRTVRTQTSEWPIGTGLGMSFQTRTGIFNLTYAVGRADGQPFSFRQAKIHFGLTSRF